MKKKIINNIITIVSFAALFFIVKQYGFGNLVNNLKTVGLKIFPITAVWLVVYLLNTFAFKIVCGKEISSKFSFRKMFALIVSSFGLNYITPVVALGGEVYKTGVLMEYTGKAEAASVVANYYSIHVIAHTMFWIMGGVYFLVNMEMTNDYINIIIAVAVFILLMLTLFNGIFRHNMIKRVYSRCCNLIKKPQKLHDKMVSKLDAVAQVNSEMTEFVKTRKNGMLAAITIELAARVFSCVEIMLIVEAIGLNITLGQSMFFLALSSLLLNILFFIPLQMGSREGIFYLIMSTIGISSEVGVYISLVTRIREIFWIFIGLICLPYNKLKPAEKSTVGHEEA